MWKIHEDGDAGALIVEVRARLDLSQLVRTKLDLQFRMASLRTVAGRARAIFDLTDYEGTSESVIRDFHDAFGDFSHDASDRFALVVPSTLDKARSRPALRWPSRSAIFLSRHAALVWLDAQK